MAFASTIRRVVSSSTSSSFASHQRLAAAFYSTLTSTKLFVSGLSQLTTDMKLKDAFAPFGQLVEAKVIVDRATGKSKGFGFVTYKSTEDAEKARQGMNMKFLDGWVIFVDPPSPRERVFVPEPGTRDSWNSQNQ